MSNGMVKERERNSAKTWIIVISSFFANGIIFGIHNCFGILYPWLRDEFAQNNVDNPSAKASFVGSLAVGMTFLSSPVAGILTDKFGAKSTALLGAILASTGMLLSAYSLNKVEALYVTYGIMFGGGSSLAYNPSLVVLGHHFDKRLGLINGIVTAGSSIFTVTLPFMLQYILDRAGLVATLQILSAVLAFLILSSIFYDIPYLEQKVESRVKIFNKDIWKSKLYIIWIIGVPLALVGYFVPYVHLVAFSEEVALKADGKWLVLCIGLTSGLGRLIFGQIADMPNINRLLIQQFSILLIGSLTMLLTICRSFVCFIILCLCLGLADGCFVALQGVIPFDICGREGASQALGFALGIMAVPISVGPPIAGALRESLGSYKIPFILAGIPPIIGSLFIFLGYGVISRKQGKLMIIFYCVQLYLKIM
ncbi:monocarboxylate transporter 10-like isoform X1 [Artemia franciscana]|uniref:monocarboxylate transporter 10-like isoform X1 n=1 Tax=Artemia franciscana TaxID=6661 RepID=UPI0032DAC77E